jgi:hypothetical protein
MMTDWRELRAAAIADVRRGWTVSGEDIAIASLVVMPFVATLLVLVSQISGLPSLWIMLLFVIVEVLATFWNAGWRARADMAAEG